MPNIPDLHPNKKPTVKTRFFDDPANATPSLVATVDVTQGRLGTAGVQKVRVPFKNDKGSASLRAVAREVVVDLKIAGDHFSLRSRPIDGGPSRGDMRFDANGDDVVNIVIGNEPAEDIFQETPRIEPVDIIVDQAAREFVAYYAMCDNVPDDPLLPYVAARPGLHQFCLVAVMNAHG